LGLKRGTIMLDAVKRYATRILLLHVVLLGLVVVIVLFAARQVYMSAREQAIEQNGKRLDLLADQTARGIENHYMSIMQDLELILRDESDTSGAATQPRAEGPRGGLGGRLNWRRFSEMRTVPVTPQLTGIMWRQLRGRVSQLFLVDTDNGRVLASFPDQTDATAKVLTADNLSWYRGLKEPTMSRFHRADEASGKGYHLIAIPALGTASPGGALRELGREWRDAGAPGGSFWGPGGREFGGRGGNGGEPPPAPVSAARTVVAVVPIDTVKERFFDPLNDMGVVNAALIDDSGAVLVSIDPKLSGANLLNLVDTDVRQKITPYLTGAAKGEPLVLGQPYKVGDVMQGPRILAFEPMQGMPGRRWTVLASAPVAESDALVNSVFRGALVWAIFLTLSVTGLLVSTAAYMIRSRIKLERTRHELLERELAQARQIQLAWLPDLKEAPEGLDVSAANLPASHISGDFYNWFVLPAGDGDGAHEASPAQAKIAVVIGDVTGHGMAAAFLMATTQLLVRTTLTRYPDPGRCLREVNRQLCTQGFRGQFVTMVVMVMDPASNSVEMAIAGHPAPIVERDGGFRPLLMEPQLVLGVDPHEHYKTEGFVLEPGCAVMLYTDGVVEAESVGGEQYGVKNMIAALKRDGGRDPEGRIAAVLEDVKRFCGGQELLDDVTMVAIRTAAAPAPVQAAEI
jgi:serine phosphatase RsbU (regulator of sigma subunit)